MPTAQVLLTGSIKPALLAIGMGSTAAQQLVLGTACGESDLKYRTQIGGGPALGLFQMEKATHDDIWDNYLKYRTPLSNKVMALLKNTDKHEQLTNNDKYAAAMCRVHYARKPQALPKVNDLDEIAKYWKKHYNTPKGAGTVAKFKKKWQLYATKAFPNVK